MRGAVLRLGAARGQLRLEQEHLLEDIAHVRQRLDDEARQRQEAEAAARALARFAQEAEAARVELQKKAQALQEECGYLRRHHQEEAQAEARDALKCDVTSALREIRAQLEGHAVQSTLQQEEWFRVRLDRLSEAAKVNTDAM
nr:RecName: Full=Neurofilament heavy polypeptide; Short=NF-H; AltName: Full=200 kDa neurofilament protein; AltName: Full=Neurofilament triplet H protein [Sus scrofa]prf//1103205A protein NF-L [Sus scrofa domesticus]